MEELKNLDFEKKIINYKTILNMNKINRVKKKIIKEIIDLELFKVATNFNKKNWILLKNGERAPVFLDTSKFSSYPKLISKLSKLIFEIIQEKNIRFDKILGLPYGGLPFAFGLSFYKNIACLSIRKEGVKKYSTSGEVLGDYKKGQRILLIEDATVTANTAINFIKRLRAQDLVVNDIVTIIDIGSLASKNLKNEKVNLHILFTWSELYKAYKKKNFFLMNNNMINFLDDLLIKVN